MKYDDLRSFIQALNDYRKQHEVFFRVKDNPKTLSIGFEAVTDNGNEYFELPLSKMIAAGVLNEEEHQIVSEYRRAWTALNDAEKAYIKLFTGQE